jgi:hypothetical protein
LSIQVKAQKQNQSQVARSRSGMGNNEQPIRYE